MVFDSDIWDLVDEMTATGTSTRVESSFLFSLMFLPYVPLRGGCRDVTIIL
jgi:hypothetical protein